MKKKIVLGCMVLGALTICSLFLLGHYMFEKEAWQGLEVVNVPCDRLIYQSMEEVENMADIIIEAKAGSELEQKNSSFYVAKFDREVAGSGHTKRELKVENVYKGNVSLGDKIVLMQDYYVWTETDGTKKVVSLTELKPLERGKHYLLFLAYDKEREAYYEVGDYQGVYPIEILQTRTRTGNVLQESELNHLYSDTEHWNLIPILKEVQEKYFR